MVRTLFLASICQKAAKVGAIVLASAALSVSTNKTDSNSPNPTAKISEMAPVGIADVASLSGNTVKSVHHIQWTTAQESNCNYFEVRRSFNGSAFNAIGQVMAAGLSNIPVNYHFTDAMAPEGTAVYQLALIDFDGNDSVAATEIALTKVATPESATQGFEVFNSLKNPGTMKLILSDQYSDAVTISIADLSGNNMMRQKVAVDAQGISEAFACNCDAGVYFVSVIANQKMRSKTLIIGN